MKAQALLETLRSFPIVDPLHLTSGEPFVILAQLPDEGSLGCGGLIGHQAASARVHHRYLRLQPT